MRILVAVEPADFRKGIDGLARVCREQLLQDPFRGILFVFRNRRATAIKIIGIVPEVVVVVEKGLSFGTVLLTKTIQYYRNSSHAEHYNVGCPQCGIRKGIFFG